MITTTVRGHFVNCGVSCRPSEALLKQAIRSQVIELNDPVLAEFFPVDLDAMAGPMWRYRITILNLKWVDQKIVEPKGMDFQ